ncbi:segregation/condensation protein A [Patescibacteria group bacterium]|nr:segregation/condensation protein A [Patescibacteria group bacterium]
MTEETRTGFTVRTPAFEGPFALVLELIEKRKLLVNDLSLAQVTDDFITHVRSQAEFPMEDAADFIQVAATLLLIKSKSLIPDLELSNEEEEDVEDFKRRLKMYEQVREATRELSRVFGRRVMVEPGERAPEPIFAPSPDATLPNLEQALADALAALEKVEKLQEARVRPMITIEEMMERLLDRVRGALSVSFKEFSGNAKEKVEIIVSFLALLELVKQGSIDAEQGEHFSDIRIKDTTTDLPKYG